MFLFKIGSTLAGWFGLQVTDKLGKVIGIIVLAVAVLIIGITALKVHDHYVAKQALANQDILVTNAVVGADRYAGDQKLQRDSDFSNSQQNVNDAIGNAILAAPEQTKKPVGPASQSYYDELRRQKGHSK